MNHAQIIPIAAGVASVDALEGRLLGAVLELGMDPKRRDEQRRVIDASGLRRDDLTTPRYAVAWWIIRVLASRPGAEIVPATVAGAGQRAGGALSAADVSWMEDLAAANTLSSEAALQVAEQIRTRSAEREIRGLLSGALEGSQRRFDPARLHGELGAIMQRLATDFDGDQTAEDDLDRLNILWAENAAAGKLMVDPTGIRLLDEAIGGAPRNIWFMQGLPGAGKNGLATTMMRAQLMRDRHLPPEERERIGVFGLENGSEWFIQRLQSEDLNIPLREIGSRVLTSEQADLKVQVDQLHRELVRRVDTVNAYEMGADEIHRRAVRMVLTRGVRRIYIDNFGEVQHTSPRFPDYVRGVRRTAMLMRNFAYRYSVPVCFLIHDMEDPPPPGQEAPPKPQKMMGGKGPHQIARMVLGVWKKGQSIRVTVTKLEKGAPDTTIELQRNFEAATFNPEGGRVLDLNVEAAEERKKAKTKGLEQKVHDGLFTKEYRAEILAKVSAAKGEPEKPVEKPAQATLLDVPPKEKP